MDSTSSRLDDERKKQVEIRKQIALLQAQLKDTVPEPPRLPQPKRKTETTLLAPATPSPKKKRKLDHRESHHTFPKPVPALLMSKPRKTRDHPVSQPVAPLPSKVFSKLADLTNQNLVSSVEDLPRSSAFSQKPSHTPFLPVSHQPDLDVRKEVESSHASAPKRDDRLALVEDLQPGPYDHTAPFDDPHFERLEPHSGIRLKCRTVSNADIHEYLTGRFYLSPSRLYSVVRLLPNQQGYDVPVAGDWVTIAVVAERGPIRFTRAPVGPIDGGNGLEGTDTKPQRKPNGPAKPEQPAKSGKKYVNIKLIDFGSRSASSATGGKAVIRGDAFLNLLLFEADGFDLVTRDDGRRPQKVYKGGSRGAFEAMSKLKEGDVVALLNPKVLKPFQGTTATPHPVNNILAITPESADSILVIGRALDLGMCSVTKRDGTLCGSWCDKRVGDVCEWHVQNAVESRRAGRAEFSIGSSGMSTTVAPKRKPAYDPARQWGLKPEAGEGTGSTYVFSGHIVANSKPSLFVSENMGRDGQARARSQMKRVDEDRELKRLLERDKEGMAAVIRAREAALEMSARAGCDKDRKKASRSRDAPVQPKMAEDGKTSKSIQSDESGAKSYSANIIRHLGFDPAVKPGQRRCDDATVQDKLDALASLQSSRKDIELGPRPGPRIRSGVFSPVTAPAVSVEGRADASVLDTDHATTTAVGEELVDLDESEGES